MTGNCHGFVKDNGVNALDNKDAFIAAKILVDFIRDYTSLAEQQLLSIRTMMEETVQDIMTTIHNMSSVSDLKRDEASQVLVRSEKGDTFEKSSTRISEERTVLQNANDAQRRHVLENQLRRAGGVFSKHMEAISSLDKELQGLLLRVTGTVSMDDVMGQRLNHVIASIALLNAGIVELLSDFERFRNPAEVKAFRNRMLTQVYRSYTAEDEKQIFHRIFGQPKEAKAS